MGMRRAWKFSLIICLICFTFHSFEKTAIGQVISISQAVEDKEGDVKPDRSGERIAVRGVVTHIERWRRASGSSYIVYVQDKTGAVEAYGRGELTTVSEGNLVELRGTVGDSHGMPEIVSPEFIRLGAEPVQPVPSKIGKINSGQCIACLVEVEGRISSISSDPTDPGAHYVLIYDETGSLSISVSGKDWVPNDAPLVQPGALVKVVGLMERYRGEEQRTAADYLEVRQKGDLAVLRRAPPLTRKQALLVVGLLLLAAGAPLTWSQTLRKRVRVKTSELVREISERQRSEEAFRTSEERYRLLFETNPLPMWVYNVDTFGFLAVNAAAIHHYGYSLEEFRSMTIMDIRASDEVAISLDTSENQEPLSSRGRVQRLKHRKKDKTLIDVEITSHSLTFDEKSAELVLIVDVTERKRAEEMASRRSRQAALRTDVSIALSEPGYPLNRVLDSCAESMVQHLQAAAAGIWTLSSKEDVLELQSSAGINTHFNGLQSRIPVGRFRPGLIAQERRPHLSNDVMLDPDACDREWAVEERVVSFAGCPLMVEDRLVGVIGMYAQFHLADDMVEALASVSDIISQGIERKRVESALRQSEEHLRQSQRLEPIGRLAGGVAHDFNNLLTAILGYSDLLLEVTPAGDERRLGLTEIKKAGQRAAELTRQLLAFSRKQILQPRTLDLNGSVLNMHKMLGRLIGEDVEIISVLDPRLELVNADPGQLEQVILNLVVNARDAMPNGGKITIQTVNVDIDEGNIQEHLGIPAGSYVMLTVADTGCGMDDETISHIFEPFFTTKGPGEGTGLGLATVYGIVQQSGGHISVESGVGRGTAFKIHLPQVDGNAELEPMGSNVTDRPATEETILLVEDEDIVLRLLESTLRKGGYDVLTAANGAEAIELYMLHRDNIKLVLTDMVMPHMGGRELVERLSQGADSVPKVLFMSGYTDDSIIRNELMEDGVPLLQKPFSPHELIAKVREVLDGRQLAVS